MVPRLCAPSRESRKRGVTPMPETPDTPAQPVTVSVTVPPARGSWLGAALVLSVLLNLVALLALLAGYWFWKLGEASGGPLTERYHSGPESAKDKVAIIEVDGVLMEGLLGHAHRQIDTAAKDPHVKAVVLRVNSPGGTITASDELYHRLVQLRDGDRPGSTGKKPLVVSMASL